MGLSIDVVGLLATSVVYESLSRTCTSISLIKEPCMAPKCEAQPLGLAGTAEHWRASVF